MSIVASVKVYDGVVVGADSRTQLTAQRDSNQFQFIKAYDHAQKLFSVEDVDVGILTYGVGNIGKRSVESYILDFKQRLQDSEKLTNRNALDSIEEITQELFNFLTNAFSTQYAETEREQWPNLGILIAGYSANAPIPEEWEFVIPRDEEIKRVREDDQFGASWRGVQIPFDRLYRGVDPRLLDWLHEKGMPDEYVQMVKQAMQDMAFPFVFDGMPLKDAIRMCEFILSTTVNTTAFEKGIASCGGPIDIAVITRQYGFQWVQSKSLIEGGE